MERSLEPELMEATTHANAYAGADFSNSDISFINRLATLAREYGLSSTSYAMLVDLGCGPGKITEELARHWPHWDILGIDGSAAMLDIALRRRDNSKSLRNLHYCQLNLTTLKDQVSNFYRQVKIIVSNSLLHHLHTPSTLWGVVEHLAAPGVNLTLHRDLRRPPNSEAASDLVQRYAGSSSAILRQDYLASLHAAFTPIEVQSQLLHYPRLRVSVMPIADRYLEVSGHIESD